MSRRGRAGVVAALLFLLCGCGAFEGPKDIAAVYTLPENKRVLVFVDVRPYVAAPPEFSAQLGQKISDQLYEHHGADKVVPQSRLTELRKDAEAFAKMGVADVAKATEADVVLHVDVVTLNVSSLSDESITQGLAQALVKVVDSKGARLWPGAAPAGAALEVQVDPALADQRDKAAVQRELTEVLAVRIGRSFHKYSPADKGMMR